MAEAQLLTGPLFDPTRQPRRAVALRPVAARPALWPAPMALGLAAALATGPALALGGNHPLAYLSCSLMACAGAALALTAEPRAWPAGRLLLAGPAVMAALALGAAVQAVWPGATIAPSEAWLAMLRWAGLAALAILVAMGQAHAGPRGGRWVGLTVLAFAAALAAGALLTETPGEGPGAGLHGPFAHRNGLASYLGLALILGLGLALPGQARPGGWTLRAMRAAALALMLALIVAALVQTRARLPVLACLAGIAAMGLVQPPGRRRHWLVLLPVLALSALALFGQELQARMLLLGQDWAMRASFYAQVWQMIAERPLAGHGAGSFALAYEARHLPPVTPDFVWDRAHSSILESWADRGLVLGSLPMAALGWAAWRFRAQARRGAPMAAAGMGAVVMIGLCALFDFGFDVPANQALAVLVLGLGLAQPPGRRRRERDGRKE